MGVRLPGIDGNLASQEVLASAGLLADQPAKQTPGTQTRSDPSGTRAVADNVEFCKIPEAVRRFGISRSGLYDLASVSLITLKKTGVRAVVVDVASLRGYLASCPVSHIRSRKQLDVD
jgi:hypothetical protein